MNDIILDEAGEVATCPELGRANLEKAMAFIQESRASCNDAFCNGVGGRNLSITVTKLDEAEMWLQKHVQSTSVKNECGVPFYKQRVIDEKRELDEKAAKLSEFINGGHPAYDELRAESQELLKSQLDYMVRYSGILSVRIDSFKEPSDS